MASHLRALRLALAAAALLPAAAQFKLPERLSIPDLFSAVRPLRACCKAMTAECLACASGVNLTDFCAKGSHFKIPGCESIAAAEAKVAQGIAPMIGKACCQAMTAGCLACQVGLNVADYCKLKGTAMKLPGCEQVSAVDLPAPVAVPAIGRLCCQATSASCFACQAGLNVADFCKLKGILMRLPECEQFAVAADSGALLCPGFNGGFKVGSLVTDDMRGQGIAVCMSAASPDLVGICQGFKSGHDNYNACKDGYQVRPVQCPLSSLWFVPCAGVVDGRLRSPLPTSLPMPSAAPSALPGAGTVSSIAVGEPNPGAPEHCGCSWSSHGCVVSGGQLFAALTDADLILAGCQTNHADHEECKVRKEIVEEAKRFVECLGLSPTDCSELHFCQWGAQGEGRCGLNEQVLVQRLVGKEHASHPLVGLILMHDHCSKLSEGWCDVDPVCHWTYGVHRSCDVRPEMVIKMMSEMPSLILDTRIAGQEASCRAQSEAKHGFTPTCHPPCHKHKGICSLDHSASKATDATLSADWMVHKLCSFIEQKDLKHCVFPCERDGDKCRVVKGKALHRPKTPSAATKRILRVFTILMSSTFVYQQQCHAPERNSPLTCSDSADVCDASKHSLAHFTPGGVLGNETMPGPGFKGIIRKAAKAFATGHAAEFLDDYLENHPESALQVTGQALESLASLFRPRQDPPTSSPTPPMTSFFPMTGSPMSSSFPMTGAPMTSSFPLTGVPLMTVFTTPQPASWAMSSTSFMPMMGQMTEELPFDGGVPWYISPWVVAAFGLALAAACGGMTMGMMCHARLVRVQAREPLLGTTQPGAAQEMESRA